MVSTFAMKIKLDMLDATDRDTSAVQDLSEVLLADIAYG